MATPTIIQPAAPVLHDVDLFARVEMDFEGVYPRIACIFRPSNTTAETNVLGRPLHSPNGELFTLLIATEAEGGGPNFAALQTLGQLMQGAAARVVAGEDFHAAMANEAYDLLQAAAALGNLEDIREQLGITVPSEFCPFPATAGDAP